MITKITLSELETLLSKNITPKINTPSGYERIVETYKKTGAGFNISFSDGTNIKAAINHRIYKDGVWVECKDLLLGDVIDGKTISAITTLKSQSWIDFSIDANHESYYYNGLLHHNSGKSMILYCVCRYITEVLGMRVLVIVPTIGLTTQLRGDFKDYSSANGWDAEKNMHLISAGADHTVNKPIVVSTFQSLAKTEAPWLNAFGAIITDEGHSITAKSFQNIYGKATNVPFRLACTGTLHDTKCNMLTMQGLTGPVYSIAETKDLISVGQLVPLKIKSLSLNYPEDICKAFSKTTYDDELNWIVTNPKRNNFIAKLASKTIGTTLVFFRFVEHGRVIEAAIRELIGDSRKIYFIDGSVKGEEREEIRHLANDEDCVVVASYGTFKAGINLPAIENMIFAHPIKGGITWLQSLGRGLRLKTGKTHCNLYDLGDCLVHKNKVNHTYRHYGSRIESLTREGYEFDIVNVPF